MKKFLALMLALMMVFALAACGKQAAPAASDTDVKGEGVMTYEEYAAAAIDDPVVVETYVQATQSWWDNTITVYSQDKDGAYFIYNMACSEEDAAKLVPGTKIKVTGYKAEWSGEIEIADATFEIEEGSYIAEPLDVTDLLGKDELADKQNMKVAFKGMTVEDSGNGILSAVSAGLKVVHIPDLANVADEVKEKSFAVLDDLSQAVKLIEGLNR